MVIVRRAQVRFSVLTPQREEEQVSLEGALKESSRSMAMDSDPLSPLVLLLTI
jgi:hypothetical protein